MIIFSPSIRSGPANTAGSENCIPEEKPTKKKIVCVGVEDREGEKGRGIGKRERAPFLLPFLPPPSPSRLKKKKNFRPFLCSLPLSLSLPNPLPLFPLPPYPLPLSTPATQAIFCQPVFLWHDSSEDSGDFSRSDAWV